MTSTVMILYGIYPYPLERSYGDCELDQEPGAWSWYVLSTKNPDVVYLVLTNTKRKSSTPPQHATQTTIHLSPQAIDTLIATKIPSHALMCVELVFVLFKRSRALDNIFLCQVSTDLLIRSKDNSTNSISPYYLSKKNMILTVHN